jgi:3-methyladenine DNA glycosylase AlkC
MMDLDIGINIKKISMAEPLKAIYNDSFFQQFNRTFSILFPEVSVDRIKATLIKANWENLELRPRMYALADALVAHLPGTYLQQIKRIKKWVILLEEENLEQVKYRGLAYLFIPDWIIKAGGLAYPKQSYDLMETLTCFTSCEFVIRHFLLDNPKEGMLQMLAWSVHPRAEVRRLASEGCRPRLPWATQLPFLRKDPSISYPILSNLIEDTDESVRRSVANHLNDISKDHPEVFIAWVKKWKSESTQTEALLKHACRGMLKQGHPEILSIWGLSDPSKIMVKDFQLSTDQLPWSGTLSIRTVVSQALKQEQLVRLQVEIGYQKANGKINPKRFHLRQIVLEPKQEVEIFWKQSFRELTTRKHYPGLHYIRLIANGKVLTEKSFYLLPSL